MDFRIPSLALVALLVLSSPLHAQSAALDIDTIGNVATAPLKWSGKFVFTRPVQVARGGKTVTEKEWTHCSAQFIAPRVLITAAHCVKQNDGTWYDTNDFYFLLQYQSGSFSRSYRVTCTVVPGAWTIEADPKRTPEELASALDDAWKWDFALMTVDADSITGHFQYRTDWWGLYNVASKTGYPVSVLSGEVIQRDEGMLVRANDIPYYRRKEGQIALLTWNPNITGGSSGGALVANFSPEESRNNNILLSVVSHSWQRPTGGRVGQFYVSQARINLPAVTFFPALTRQSFQSLLNTMSKEC